MSKSYEDIAKKYLCNEFINLRYKFEDKSKYDKGFDLWLIDFLEYKSQKVELKTHTGSFRRQRDLIDRLVFNAEIEKTLFENGDSIIVRVFLGDSPPKVFIVTNDILNAGAKLISEARYTIRGKINYTKSITNLQ